MELRGKNILVIGLGRTGVATAKFLSDRGARVMIADQKAISELGNTAALFKGHADIELGIRDDDTDVLLRTDMIVPSPGVPPSNCLLEEGLRMGIPILSELELASRYLKKPAVAITGTNGKTTTTSLLGRIFEQCGRRVFVGGNIGNPLISYVNGKQEDDFAVLEVSSFQLQWVRQFHPFIAVLLNVTSDHIDYHGSFEEYRSVKERIFACQGTEDYAILNVDDPESEDLSQRLPAGHVVRFSSSSRLKEGIFIDGDCLRYRFDGKDEEYPIRSIRLKGRHNLENTMAAVIAARICGCPPAGIIETLESFTGIPHRIEFAGSIDGVDYYDDSKGTNVDAVYRALEAFHRPVVLLVGGRYKGGDFGVLTHLIRERVKMLIAFGEAGKKILSVIGGIVKTERAEGLKSAVYMARDNASSGDIVLLSPGCSSFDEFKNYEERGMVFKDIVEHMGHEKDERIWANHLQQ
ncbi:MAG TPA: UDP-N-acetylmuramoyl-L-alanine--D-glutamate ligase [Syntrophales bacterium]|nr:UDP-N-acetylmuramoyl-L-alanine--D-glutamate ligase [Syntrophales bacterium]HPQ43449.1 UDP-N-acetylmuramoyl-L-alanine--D-glutamate ligase [Syntrophales bacterium]